MKKNAKTRRKSTTRRTKARGISKTAFWRTLYGDEVSEAEFRFVQAFNALKEQEKVSAARKSIQSMLIDASEEPTAVLPFAFQTSENLLPGYATLDDPHREEIKRVIAEIAAYLEDPSRKRPFNCL